MAHPLTHAVATLCHSAASLPPRVASVDSPSGRPGALGALSVGQPPTASPCRWAIETRSFVKLRGHADPGRCWGAHHRSPPPLAAATRQRHSLRGRRHWPTTPSTSPARTNLEQAYWRSSASHRTKSDGARHSTRETALLPRQHAGSCGFRVHLLTGLKDLIETFFFQRCRIVASSWKAYKNNLLANCPLRPWNP